MSRPRSLADDLRRRDDAELTTLLTGRPDLVHPAPSDITALATRATTGPSVVRCLDNVDGLLLFVLSCAASTLDSLDAADIVSRATEVLGAEAKDACQRALDDLIGLGLIWGDGDALNVVTPARELVVRSEPPAWPLPTAIGAPVGTVDDIDDRAAGHARASVDQVRDLLDMWSMTPPSVLRTGGLPLREFGITCRDLGLDIPATAMAIEVAHAARLLADDREESPSWVPTDRYDLWLTASPARQWADLAMAWLGLQRLPSTATERTQLLNDDGDRRAIPVLREQVLSLLAELPHGHGLNVEGIRDILAFRHPRRAGDLMTRVIDATLFESEMLGVTSAGALCTAGRALVTTRDTAASAAAIEKSLVPDIDHIIIQADLTIVAPGPLPAAAWRELRLVADVESRGHATVFRISEKSVRRALDAGRDAATIHALLTKLSRTPVPQPLTYLVDDVARKHGSVRVGRALGYVRCDNPETVAAILADRRLRDLGLSRLADTVLVSQADVPELIADLRSAGYAPAAESADGVVVVRRPEDRRTPAERTRPVTVSRRSEGSLIDAVVRGLRAGERAATAVGPMPDMTSQSPSAVVAVLRAAMEESRPVWLGYADTNGTITTQVVDPVRLGGGVLVAYDHATETVRTFSVSRVTGITDLDAVDA